MSNLTTWNYVMIGSVTLIEVLGAYCLGYRHAFAAKHPDAERECGSAQKPHQFKKWEVERRAMKGMLLRRACSRCGYIELRVIGATAEVESGSTAGGVA
jgi:hypothetical protein